MTFIQLIICKRYFKSERFTLTGKISSHSHWWKTNRPLICQHIEDLICMLYHCSRIWFLPQLIDTWKIAKFLFLKLFHTNKHMSNPVCICMCFWEREKTCNITSRPRQHNSNVRPNTILLWTCNLQQYH